MTRRIAADVAKVVAHMLDDSFPSDQHTRVSEPGRCFVEAAFMLASRICKVGIVDDDDETTQRRHHATLGHDVQGVFKENPLCADSTTSFHGATT
jgi:hypothetical protein